MNKPEIDVTETQDLDDKDLESVSGGIDGADGGCIPTPWKKKTLGEALEA